MPPATTSVLTTRRKRSLSNGLGSAYATLGLRVSEARVDAIRSAAQASAAKLQEVVADPNQRIELLSSVATSAYRLLDPRRRANRLERIQLCIVSERASELQQAARRPLI
ncbi:MAG: hypothetical protein KF752_15335 [Pirellulaceae bacterium]|nr:hypothetical protein [Pirellulaceae bacterium]